jgi:endonuclease/exonuclease/phosphatase family metal-dependent hydrolase
VPKPAALKMLSYNILEGGNGRMSDILRVIRAQAPDAVALLEANSHANAKSLARELGMQFAFGRANSKFHVAWLSRLPIVRSTNYRPPILSKTMLEIEVNWHGAPLHLFATHLAGGSDGRLPLDEVPSILELLRPFAGRPHLLTGDFNALGPDDPVGVAPVRQQPMRDAVHIDPRQAIRSILQAGYTDCYRATHPLTPGYTYPADMPWIRLDYVFASPLLAAGLHDAGVVCGDPAARASDHFPVWAEFRAPVP